METRKARSLLLEELTRVQAADVAAEGIVVLPVGSTEQHGPHLPAGTDTMQVEHIARHAAEAVRALFPIAVAPTLPFGSSHQHLPFGATVSMGNRVYYEVLAELGASLAVAGFSRIFVLNGHGGNHDLVQAVVGELPLQHDVHVAGGSWWTIAWDALVREGATALGFPGHAGAFETSTMLALRPDLVASPPERPDSAPTARPSFRGPYRTELHGAWQRIDGWSDSPARGSAELGKAFLEVAIAEVAGAFRTFYAAARAADGVPGRAAGNP